MPKLSWEPSHASLGASFGVALFPAYHRKRASLKLIKSFPDRSPTINGVPVPEASPAPESLIDIELAPPRLHGLRDLAERWALYSGFNHLDAGKILSGVDEALANIHLHSYGSRPGPVHLEIRLSKGELIFEISDHGKTFDLEHGASRKAGEVGMGGWGTLMMQNGFQRIERRRVGNKNILLLACHLPIQKGER